MKIPFVATLLLASLAMAAAKASQDESTIAAAAAAGHGRSLQTEGEDSDPCQPLLGTDIFNTGGTPFTFIAPSFYERCFESIPVNSTNMLHHLENLDGLFSDYYAFYHITKDPSDSDPASYQPELGYSIFGEGEGQVDIDGRIGALMESVMANGASLATFWEMNAIFQELRDAHINMPELQSDILLNYEVVAIPGGMLSGGLGAKSEFMLNETTGEYELRIEWQNLTDGTIFESWVDTINGKNVSGFVVDMANTLESSLVYQSLGARINELMKSPAGWNPTDPLIWLFATAYKTKPSQMALPDDFVVTYKDGGEETYFTSLLNNEFVALVQDPEGNEKVFPRELVQKFVNTPGSAFILSERAVGQIVDAISETFHEVIGTSPGERKLGLDSVAIAIDPEEQQHHRKEQVVWEKEYMNDPETLGAAFVVGEDYAVLKLQDYAIPPDQVSVIWTDLLMAAKEKGVTKLIVDISGNGGGYALSGLLFAVAMFPNTAFEFFEDQFDLTYSEQMQTYIYLREVLDLFQDITDNEWDDAVKQSVAEGLAQDQLNALNITAQSLLTFCNLNERSTVNAACEVNQYDICTHCNDITNLVIMVNGLMQSPNNVTYTGVMNQVIQVAKAYSPWSVTGQGAIFLAEGLSEPGRTVVRGGTEYNLTVSYAYMTPEQHEEVAAAALAVGWQFDEYVLVSDGAGGSTTSIFATGIEQIWKNRDLSGASTSLVTVGYGGTGKREDATMAGFPAAVESVQIDNPFFTVGAFFMLPVLLPESNFNLTEINDLLEVGDLFSEKISKSPYFSLTLPRMPVENFYNNFMNPGALPLQYVKMPPDEFIPRLFTKVTVENSADLEDLYYETSQFFSSDETDLVAIEKSSASEPKKPIGEEGAQFENTMAAGDGEEFFLPMSGASVRMARLGVTFLVVLAAVVYAF